MPRDAARPFNRGVPFAILGSMKPVIGINGDVKADPEPAIRIKLNYVDAVRRAGGIPVVLPAAAPEDAAALLERIDGIVLTGGGDLDVRGTGTELHASVELMEPRRQAFDLALARALRERTLRERAMPALGICLGMQELAFADGAPLHQHLPDAGIAGLLDHRAEHDVAIVPGSRLEKILGVRSARVVSHHHQGVTRAPGGMRVVATAPDGVIEAFEDPDAEFFIGVQWHPERAPQAQETQRLFAALVAAAGR
jgi:putative glutamine amidotransferase